MKVEEKYIEAQVGSMSLIGVGKQRPCSWGNYFWFAREEYRCINMWAENLNTARERFLPDGLVKVRVYEGEHMGWAVVIDERIPKEWRYDTCCYTGGWRPGIEIARDIYETLGDPDNELEWWTDNEMYHAKRCEEVVGNGTIKCYYPRTEETRTRLIANLLEKRGQS